MTTDTVLSWLNQDNLEYAYRQDAESSMLMDRLVDRLKDLGKTPTT